MIELPIVEANPAPTDTRPKRPDWLKVRLPMGECPPRLATILADHRGELPVTFEYRSKEGLVARVKAGHELRLKHDPDLAEKLARETGCSLSWTY